MYDDDDSEVVWSLPNLITTRMAVEPQSKTISKPVKSCGTRRKRPKSKCSSTSNPVKARNIQATAPIKALELKVSIPSVTSNTPNNKAINNSARCGEERIVICPDVSKESLEHMKPDALFRYLFFTLA